MDSEAAAAAAEELGVEGVQDGVKAPAEAPPPPPGISSPPLPVLVTLSLFLTPDAVSTIGSALSLPSGFGCDDCDDWNPIISPFRLQVHG